MRLLQECRSCGCTDDHACLDPDGRVCSWVAWDECSACAGRGRLHRVDGWVEARKGRLALVVAFVLLVYFVGHGSLRLF